MKMKKVFVLALSTLLLGCLNTKPDLKQKLDVSLMNFNKSLWNVPDSVRIGTVIRIERDEGNFVVAVKYSDFIARSIPSDKIDSTKDLDQTVTFNDSKSFAAAIDLIKPFGGPSEKLDGSQVGGKYGSGRSAKLSFKNVTVQQIDHLPLLLHIQDLDIRKDKDREGNELFHQINMNGQKIKEDRTNAKYWIVTKVFMPKEVEWAINDKSDSGVSFNCNFVGVKCGKLDFGITDSSGIVASGAKTLYVVIKPLYTDNGVIRIDSLIRGPRSINES
jgi:hypothetical protein